jgi:TusA-related sulfurtransferase
MDRGHPIINGQDKMATFDLRETIIPFSLLQISNHFKRMKPGEALEILCCDENIARDLSCILPRLEYEIDFSEAPETKRTEFLICLKKLAPAGR